MREPPDRNVAKTVIRPAAKASAPDPRILASLAEPVLALASALKDDPVRDVARALDAAADRLRRFEATAAAAGIPQVSIAPARYGLAVLLDAHARANRDIALDPWAAGAHTLLFDGRDHSLAGMRDLKERAADAGPAYADVEALLNDLIARIEALQKKAPVARGGGRVIAAALLAVASLTLAGLAWLDWRHHARTWAEFEAATALLPLDRNRSLPILATALDQMAAHVAEAEVGATQAPTGVVRLLPALDAGTRARARYAEAAAQTLYPPLFEAIDLALATEGEDAALYDTIRARAVLTGALGWQPSWIAGWAEDRETLMAGLSRIGAHVDVLPGPDPDPPAADDAVLAQAREFAAEADEAERAYLELVRSAEATALPGWSPTAAIGGIGDVMVRRSGLPLDAPIAGIHTAAGWMHAHAVGAGVAVQAARANAPFLLGNAAKRRNDAPDRVLDLLQRRTLDTWSAFLTDLRVRPFTDPDSAILISGTLSRRNSPLTRLLQEVWAETGGTDRSRSHPNQLAIATRFGPMIQFVEQGRMDNISNLFGALNVALGAMGQDQRAGLDRLMSVQQRANSIAALSRAPTVVVQIVEDVLAQTATAHDEVMQNPISRMWQAEVAPQCAALTASGFPFTDGPGANFQQFTEVFAPGGNIDRFFRLRLSHLMDTETTPWRWKPEGALAGLDQESAAFFQKAAAIREAFFDPSGSTGQALTLTTLAERGTASVTLGGTSAPVRATGEPSPLAWPGPDPRGGVVFAVRQGNAADEISHPGHWGLLRLLDPLRLRARDDGQRFLIDLRFSGARFFLEMEFERTANPVSARSLLKNLVCPAVL